jgi:endonuclease-3
MSNAERNRLRSLVAWIDRKLVQTYGEPRPPRPGDPLDGLIATILSQNTNDINSGRAYEALISAYPTWDAAMRAPRKQLEEVLRPGGLARTKSARIQRILRQIAETGALSLDSLRDRTNAEAEAYLLGFEGVGYKTARCVLLFDLGRDVFPIDTHVYRILTRMGVIPPGMSADRAHKHMPPLIAKGRCFSLHVNLIRHGRQVCHARNPACMSCPLRRRCVYYSTGGGTSDDGGMRSRKSRVGSTERGK